LGKVADYFLIKDQRLTRKSRFDIKRIMKWGGLLFVSLLLFFIMMPTEKGKKNFQEQKTDTTLPTSNQYAPAPEYEEAASHRTQVGRNNRSFEQRNYSAQQVVKGSDNSGKFSLSSGSTIRVKLLNRVLSSDKRAPVKAGFTQSVTIESGIDIPEGTLVLGQSEFDEGTERLFVYFHTLVLEDGTEKAINASAMMLDGSMGLEGDYHAQTMKKQGGRMLGTFLGGLASGFKDRSIDARTGEVFTPGNLKNAFLNGVAESSFDQAKDYGQKMQNTSGYLEVNAGTDFLIYFEKGLNL